MLKSLTTAWRDWPDTGATPAKLTLWKWLTQAVREGRVLQQGDGTRKEPFRYYLPGMIDKWQAEAAFWAKGKP